MAGFDFAKLLQQKLPVHRRQIKTNVIVKKGKPAFTEDDILSTVNPIARILRMFFVSNQITEEEFFDKHRQYGESIGLTPTTINTDKHNKKKELFRDRVTVSAFEKIIDILGYRITDITFHIQDPKTGKVTEYRTSQAEQMCGITPGTVKYDPCIDDEDKSEDI